MYYEVVGRDDPDAMTVVVSAGLGGLAHFWRPQLDVLAAEFRVITYDHRGTGRNAALLPQLYSIGTMADDVLEILNGVEVGHCHFIGHALGGLVGLELALREPTRVSSLILANSWAKPNLHTERCFAMRRELLKNSGIAAYVRAQPIFLYPADWLEEHAAQIAQEEAAGIRNFQGESNLLSRMDALLRFDITDGLPRIAAPTLVTASQDDVLVPWTCSRFLAGQLPNAELWLSPKGGHAFTVVEPAAFNERMLAFLRV